MNLYDPCTITKLVPTIDGVTELHSLIEYEGNNDFKSISFVDFTDEKSESIDSENDDDYGYLTCGPRVYELWVNDKRAGKGQYKQYAWITTDLTQHNITLNYGSESRSDIGEQYIELRVYLDDYDVDLFPAINNTAAAFNITFYELLTDMSIVDQTYTLLEADLVLNVPEIVLSPAIDPEYTYELLLMLSGVPSDLPNYLGVFSPDKLTLEVSFNSNLNIGLYNLRYQVTANDKLNGTVLYTDFQLFISPQIKVFEFIEIKPEFDIDLGTFSSHYDVVVGTDWSYDLPGTKHELDKEVVY